MAQGNAYEIWTRFVEAKYLTEAKTYKDGKCPTCNSPRDCNNYYCLHCRIGGLCPITFRGNGAHTSHRWLQVRRQSGKSAVDPKDLNKYLPEESVDHIQSCLLNGSSLCYLETDHHGQASASAARPPAKLTRTGTGNSRGLPSALKSCEACNRAIANSQDCELDFLLCSVECLVTLAQRQPEKNLLQMREGALIPTKEFPQTAMEKIKGKLKQTTGSSSKSGSKVARAEIADRSGSSSGGHGGENDAEDSEPPAVIRGSSGKRSAPVNYRTLHRGGGARPGSGTAAARTRAGATTAAARTRDSQPGARLSRFGPAGRRQAAAAPDYSAYPRGYRSAGLHALIAAAKANGDWDLYLGNMGRDVDD